MPFLDWIHGRSHKRNKRMKWQETASWWSWEGKEGSSVEKVETESSRPIRGFVPLLDRVLVRFPPLAYGKKGGFFGGPLCVAHPQPLAAWAQLLSPSFTGVGKGGRMPPLRSYGPPGFVPVSPKRRGLLTRFFPPTMPYAGGLWVQRPGGLFGRG